MGPAAIAALPPLISGGASLVGGLIGNRAARQEAERNRRFQERMRNTAWQAAVSDMRAAGLNPALAYSKGPAQSPGGSMASQADPVSPAVSSAMQGARLRRELELLSAQVDKAQGEATVARNQAWWSEQERDYYDADRPGRPSVRIDRPRPSYIEERRGRLLGRLGADFSQRVAQSTQASNLARMSGVSADFTTGVATPWLSPARKISGMAAGGISQLADMLQEMERARSMHDDSIRAFFGMSRSSLESLIRAVRRVVNSSRGNYGSQR